jgi:energy-coupling factor transporter ATP-binding protein EcfA2
LLILRAIDRPGLLARTTVATPTVALTSLSIRDFRGIDHLDLDFRGPDGRPNQLVVLAGPNGSGKTAVLEAALIALGAPERAVGPWGRPAIRKGADNYEISAVGEAAGVSRTLLVTSNAGIFPYYRSLYYPSSRATSLVGPVGATLGSSDRPAIEEHADRLKAIKRLLVDSATRARFRPSDPSLLANYTIWIDNINKSWGDFYPDCGGRFDVDLAEPEGAGFDVFLIPPDGTRLEIDYLSSGQLELFLFLAGLAHDQSRPGIVLIDEPELHLDPQWHRPIMRSLIRLQPVAQFIVATHSPEIYDAARSYERHFLVPEDDPRAKLWRPVGAEV